MAPLTIKKPETLRRRLMEMEQETLRAAENVPPGELAVTRRRINGREVTFMVRRTHHPGRVYRLYHLDNRPTRRDVLPGLLLPA